MALLEHEAVGRLVEKDKLYLLGGYVNKRTMQFLVAYSRDRANTSRDLSLVEIVQLVNKCESTLHYCQLQAPMNMPR